jgi:hypothetical protein
MKTTKHFFYHISFISSQIEKYFRQKTHFIFNNVFANIVLFIS